MRCAPGKIAVGGGSGDNDGAGQQHLNIVTSAPVQIGEDGKLSSDGPAPAGAYSPIEGDPDGSYVPNGWLVEGYFDAAPGSVADISVRPHVICGKG